MQLCCLIFRDKVCDEMAKNTKIDQLVLNMIRSIFFFIW